MYFYFHAKLLWSLEFWHLGNLWKVEIKSCVMRVIPNIIALVLYILESHPHVYFELYIHPLYLLLSHVVPHSHSQVVLHLWLYPHSPIQWHPNTPTNIWSRSHPHITFLSLILFYSPTQVPTSHTFKTSPHPHTYLYRGQATPPQRSVETLWQMIPPPPTPTPTPTPTHTPVHLSWALWVVGGTSSRAAAWWVCRKRNDDWYRLIG